MTNYKNRGKWLEQAIESSNRQYQERSLALIHKIPTPMAKNSRNGQYFYSAKSTVDFVGISLGEFIAFDTKETAIKTFEFKNVKAHQVDYLTQVRQQGGQAFLLIYFRPFNELYKLDIDTYNHLVKTIGRKSIPYKWFRDNKEPIRSKNGVYFDYLGITDKTQNAGGQ